MKISFKKESSSMSNGESTRRKLRLFGKTRKTTKPNEAEEIFASVASEGHDKALTNGPTNPTVANASTSSLRRDEDHAVNAVRVKKAVVKSAALQDLADEKNPSTDQRAARFRSRFVCSQEIDYAGENTNNNDNYNGNEVDPITIVRNNLPPDPLLSTPFGTRRMTYADYTASGRSLHFIEQYIQRVVNPLYANTHTETSASGLQTTHFREEARSIILQSLHADPKQYSLIFTGTGSTGAIAKLVALLRLNDHSHHETSAGNGAEAATGGKPVLVLCSQCEHHSNELLWRETTAADVLSIPNDTTGSLDLTYLKQVLEDNSKKYETIVGSFTAGSNVTGLTTKPGPVADLIHHYGGYVCFDYAGAAPYKDMKMTESDTTYLDAIYISPHKFVGGPGTPGLLCIRKDFANCRNGIETPPTIAGGGTVAMVWSSEVDHAVADSSTNRVYETILHVREEAGTPGVVESIRCGLAFYVRNLVGAKRIEELEGNYAKEAVERMHRKQIWVMGDVFSNITSTERLSITSFNIWCKIPKLVNVDLARTDVPVETLVHPRTGRPLMLHFHFVAALLNDLYGIQARSGCACAGPLSFRLFGPRYPYMTQKAIQELVGLAVDDFHSLKPGFCRVNFNYFIDKEEFDYIMTAIEQIAEHGWKLLPLYAICLKTGQYWYNGLVEHDGGTLESFSRFDAVRRIQEIEFQPDGSVVWNEARFSKEDRCQYLEQAMQIYDEAPAMVRQMLFRYRDLRRRDMQFPEKFQEYRFFALGSEVLPYLGITEQDLQAAQQSTMASDEVKNPRIVSFPKHPTANPMFTMDRPRG